MIRCFGSFRPLRKSRRGKVGKSSTRLFEPCPLGKARSRDSSLRVVPVSATGHDTKARKRRRFRKAPRIAAHIPRARRREHDRDGCSPHVRPYDGEDPDGRPQARARDRARGDRRARVFRRRLLRREKDGDGGREARVARRAHRRRPPLPRCVSFIARIARIAFSRVRSARISRRIALSRLASLASRRSPRRRRCDRRRLFGAGFWYRGGAPKRSSGRSLTFASPSPSSSQQRGRRPEGRARRSEEGLRSHAPEERVPVLPHPRRRLPRLRARVRGAPGGRLPHPRV